MWQASRRCNPSPLQFSIQLVAFLSLMVFGTPGFAGAQAEGAAVYPFYEGVLASQNEVYVMTPDGGLGVFAIDTGESIWTHAEAARPLVLVDGVLVAQVDLQAESTELGIAGLDTRTGGEVLISSRSELPGEHAALIEDGLGETFRIWAFTQDGKVRVAWRAKSWTVQGAISFDDDGLPRKSSGLRESSGLVELDLQKRAAKNLPLKGMVPSSAHFKPLHHRSPMWTAHPGLQYLSHDERHVLVSENLEPEKALPRYRWSLFETSTGELVGSTESLEPTAPFVVSGRHLLFIEQPRAERGEETWSFEPLRLTVVDLAGGLEQWSRPIRDTRYHGPVPH